MSLKPTYLPTTVVLSGKKLIFGEGFIEQTVAGEKLITLRKYRPEAHDFKKGEVIIGEFKDGMTILLEITADTEIKPFNRLTDAEAQEDGYADARDAFEGLRKYYADLKKKDLCATIRYQVLRIGGVPVVSYNA